MSVALGWGGGLVVELLGFTHFDGYETLNDDGGDDGQTDYGNLLGKVVAGNEKRLRLKQLND